MAEHEIERHIKMTTKYRVILCASIAINLFLCCQLITKNREAKLYNESYFDHCISTAAEHLDVYISDSSQTSDYYLAAMYLHSAYTVSGTTSKKTTTSINRELLNELPRYMISRPEHAMPYANEILEALRIIENSPIDAELYRGYEMLRKTMSSILISYSQ